MRRDVFAESNLHVKGPKRSTKKLAFAQISKFLSLQFKKIRKTSRRESPFLLKEQAMRKSEN